ncbi:MAG: AAA family ATPase [Dehalococcoidales bacterium]|nr:AAA family ATPase [Dehalococcoidales bacterium]
MKEGDLDLLKQIAEHEVTIDWSKPGADLGWEWSDVRIQPATLTRLFLEGLLDNPYRSNSCTGYRLSEKGKQVFAAGEAMVEPAYEPNELEVPDDLFSVIEGYQELKDLVRTVLKSDKPVHLLFTGVPASAKTMFLMELARLGAPYVLGSQATRSGMADLLFSTEPRILLVDEIDRIGTRDISVLLSLMATGIVSETKHGKRRSSNLDTKVFAASNTLRMPLELLSRFMVLEFKPYSLDEFLTVATNVLVKQEGILPDLAVYIVRRTWQLAARFPDPRQAVRVARLAKTRVEVDGVFELLERYGAGLTK